MIKGNKGEWSEIYTLLKVISDKKLYVGDASLNKIEELIYPIIKILREETGQVQEYSYDNDLVIIKNQKEEVRIPVSKFAEQSKILLSRLQEKTRGTFSIPEVEDFMRSFNCKSLKAKSSVKSDIRVVIHDHRTGINPELGFSIKSKLGSASTLLNAGKTTNFVFKVLAFFLTEEKIEEINQIDTRSKIKDRIEEIMKHQGRFVFAQLESAMFENNLKLIDSELPSILSNIIYLFYTSDKSTVVDLVAEVKEKNPLNYDLGCGQPFYEYKIKRFLTDVALGMMPASVWTGQLDSTGGYLVVKEDGEILCYHIYNRNEFEDYLYANTKLDTASSKRHGFGQIHKKNEEFYFTLNLQIRFK